MDDFKETYCRDEIKHNADCREYLRNELGATERGKSGQYTSFDNPWRPGSNSGALNAVKDHWHDHVSGEKGDVISLAMAGNNCDYHSAQLILGRWLHLEQKTRQAECIDCVYDYKSGGIIVHQTVRMKPKRFFQRRPDPDKPGQFINGLGNVERVLYRIDEWKDAERIVIVGGEKDADRLWDSGFAATTCPMGEGNWRAGYNKYLEGKDLVVIPDNDDAGRVFVNSIQDKSLCIAKSMRVVDLGLPAKGADVSDWIKVGGTKADLEALIMAAEDRKRFIAIKNYRVLEVETGGGKKKEVKEPLHINQIVDHIRKSFDGFPMLLGDCLFDYRAGKITAFRSPGALEAWVGAKSHEPPQIEPPGRTLGCASWRAIYEGLIQSARTFDNVANAPHSPSRHNVFYDHPPLPSPNSKHKRFHQLMDFFCPSTPEDGIMIRALFASPMFYDPGADRPIWIVDSDTGQASGKTKLIELLAFLYNSPPFYVDATGLTNERDHDRMLRTLLTQGALGKRVFLLDNVTGFFKSATLASMATSAVFSGLAPYGRNEVTRENDLTFCITSNSASMDRDLISRSMIISVSRDDAANGSWLSNVRHFISSYRWEILADVAHIVQSGSDWPVMTQSRFRAWESHVLAPMCGHSDVFEDCHKLQISRREGADQEIGDAEMFNFFVEGKLQSMAIFPEQPVWLSSAVINDWAQKILPGLGGKNSRGAKQCVHNWQKLGLLPNWSFALSRFPTSSRLDKPRSRGVMIRSDKFKAGSDQDVAIVIKDSDGIILKI